MVRSTVEAIFEHGVFRPLEADAISVREGQHVRLHVEANDADEAHDVLRLAIDVYAGLRDDEINEIEQIAPTGLLIM